MRILISWMGCLMILTGCVDHKVSPKPFEENNPVPRIAVVGGGAFPQFLAGDWQCHTEPWVIHFDEDGSISWLDHPVGGIMQTAEGGSFEERQQGVQKATFFAVLGPVSGQYDPATQVLKLSIALDRYEMVLPQGSLEGKVLDEFTGKLDPEKGQWQAAHVSIGWLEGGEQPDEEAIRANPDQLLFVKEKYVAAPDQPAQP